MSHICVVGGGGYVGLGYAVALARLGNDVLGLDIDAERVAMLNAGEAPLFEAGIDALLAEGLASGRLRFTTSYDDALDRAEFVFLCTGTPSLSDGEADLRQVRAAARAVGSRLRPGRRVIVVNKSTMPVGAAEMVATVVGANAPEGTDFRVVSNPEFLREGMVVHDILNPDRIVLGGDDPAATAAVAALYAPLGAPVIETDHRSAELIKYAANAFLATKISFVNDIARLCERLGADVTVVAEGMGKDPRIGPRFLQAGIGFGGSCFPKDVGALTRMAEGAGLHPGLLRAVLEINADARRRFVTRTDAILGGLEHKTIAVLGLAFKEGTDDLRESPAISVIDMLEERGATVRAHDPRAMENAARKLPHITLCEDAYSAAEGADAVLICTPWQEYAEIDLDALLARMRGNLLMDGRNLLDPALAAAAGFQYEGIGRKDPTASQRPAGIPR
ncbi:MAG: UDP-glucose dehydrogenase family protein [Thermomicrobiales bacterium]